MMKTEATAMENSRFTTRTLHRGRRAVCTVAVAILIGAIGHAQFGGGANSEQKLVARYDKDKDGRLNRAERQAARAAVGGGFQQFGFRRGFRADAVDAAPGRKLAPADVRPYPTTPVYDLGTLRTIFLQFEDPDWEAEMADFKNTDVDVPATMIVDGRTYKEVGVHFRGASSFMMVPAPTTRSTSRISVATARSTCSTPTTIRRSSAPSSIRRSHGATIRRRK